MSSQEQKRFFNIIISVIVRCDHILLPFRFKKINFYIVQFNEYIAKQK